MLLLLIVLAKLSAMQAKRILILGGTSLARRAADVLVFRGFDVTSSLAGVTQNPLLPKGKLRVGGFGGVDGLRNYLQAEGIELVIDATHPFAAKISAHTVAAAGPIQVIRLSPPHWEKQSGDTWIDALNIAQAVENLPHGVRVAATVGRKEIEPFFERPDLSGVVRMIELPPVPVPPRWTLVQERPPFTVDQELGLFAEHHIQYLVSKNAGGARAAKLGAAAQVNIPVVMIARPFKPPAQTFSTVEDLLGSLA